MLVRLRWLFAVGAIAMFGLVLTSAGESPRLDSSPATGASLTSAGSGLPDVFRAVPDQRGERWTNLGFGARLLLMFASGAAAVVVASGWSRRELSGYPRPTGTTRPRSLPPRAPPTVLV